MSSEGHDPSASGSGAEIDPLIGQVIDKRYRLTRKLGEGGMGEVYAADHLRISRSVAIKLLRPEVLTNEEAVKRFEQEAMLASSIGHENIIRIEDSGKLEDGRIYLAMELLAGLPFNDLIEQPVPIAPHRLLNILIQTCHGLAAAHNKKIVHRDMKPENIYITTGGDGGDVPKLLDFGIAKVSQAEGENHLTRTGTIFGTPFYMAPEQALGQAVDHRVDVYAMGVIMYEVFCGVVPFGGESFMGILTQHITAEPVLPSLTAQQNGRVLPAGIEDVIVRAMKKEPTQRFQNMEELVDALVPIYRSLAGAGMSTYMEAHTPDPSYMSTPTNPQAPVQAHQSAHQSAGYSAAVPTSQHNPAHDTGQPYQAPPPQMGTAPPDAGQYGTHSSGGYAGASDSMMAPARKSRAGLLIAIFLLLCAGGGAAAYFLFVAGGDDDSGAVATGDPTDESEDVEDPANVATDEAIDASVAGTTDPIPAADVMDASVAAQVPPDAKTPETTTTTDPLDPPKAVMVTVLIESRPPGATIHKNGKKIGKTSKNVKVRKGEAVEYVLKLRRHKELRFTIDGSNEKFTGRLTKKAGNSNNNTTNNNTNNNNNNTNNNKPPPPPRDPCKKNPNLPECMLE